MQPYEIGTVVSACLSFVGSLIVCLCCVFFDSWKREYPSIKHVIFCLAFFDCVAAANYFYSSPSENYVCHIQASIMQMFEIGSWLWNGAFSVELLAIVSTRNSSSIGFCGVLSGRKRLIAYHFIIWGFSISTTLYSYFAGYQGFAGKWCWISRPLYRVGLGYIPLWITIVVIITSSTRLYRLANYSQRQRSESGDARKHKRLNMTSDDRQRMLNRAIAKIALIPLVFIILHIPGSTRRVMEFSSAKLTSSTAYLMLGNLQQLTDPLHGFVVFVLQLVTDKSLRMHLFSSNLATLENNNPIMNNSTSKPAVQLSMQTRRPVESVQAETEVYRDSSTNFWQNED